MAKLALHCNHGQRALFLDFGGGSGEMAAAIPLARAREQTQERH